MVVVVVKYKCWTTLHLAEIMTTDISGEVYTYLHYLSFV